LAENHYGKISAAISRMQDRNDKVRRSIQLKDSNERVKLAKSEDGNCKRCDKCKILPYGIFKCLLKVKFVKEYSICPEYKLKELV